MRQKTGWESYSQEPATFMQEVLQMHVAPRSKARLMKLMATDERRIGLVWKGHDADEDIATLTVGIAIWRAATQGRSSILIGGRPSIAEGWHQHACLVLNDAANEIKRDFLVIGREGLRCVNGAWLLRYDGPMKDDYWTSYDVAPKADIIFGDLEWANRDTIDEALDDADRSDAITIMITNTDD